MASSAGGAWWGTQSIIPPPVFRQRGDGKLLYTPQELSSSLLWDWWWSTGSPLPDGAHLVFEA